MQPLHRLQSMRGPRDGAAALTVLGFIVVICAMLAMMSGGAVQRAYLARKLSDRVRALMYAEAGANHAYTILEADWNQRTNGAAFPLTQYGMGSIDVEVTATSNNMAIIRSHGYCRSSDVSVVVDLANYGPAPIAGQSWESEDFKFSVLAGGEFDFTGCGGIAPTNFILRMHANGALKVSGDADTRVSITSSDSITINNNVTINGSIAAPDLDYNTSKVTITETASEQAVAFEPIPDVDLTPYYLWAEDHGEVYTGFSASGGTYNPNGGLIWVQGDVHISGNTQFNGTIIATGDITFSGSSSLTAGDTGFSMVSRDGNIRFTTSGSSNGIMYAKTGDIDHTANGLFTGQLVAAGNIKKAGNSGQFVFTETVPTLPGNIEGREGQVIIGVSAWQE